MNFKTYFYTLLKESPDSVPNGTWTDSDARAFIIHPDFFCLAMTPKKKHSDMLEKLYELSNKHLHNIKDAVKEDGILYHGNFNPIEPVMNFIKTGNRTYLLKYSAHKKLGVMVGRIWVDKNEISFWNNIQDINMKSVNAVTNIMDQYFHKDCSTFTWEVFEKENPTDAQPVEAIYTLDELEDRLQDTSDQDYVDVNDHGETVVTKTQVGNNPQWDKLHLTPPEQKGELMKKMGIKPKAPMGAEARYLRGESVE